MKRIAVLLLSILLLATTTFAEGIDFGSMTIEELQDIKGQAEVELVNRGASDLDILPKGTYVVGEDMVEGSYSITSLFDLTSVAIWENLAMLQWNEEYRKSISSALLTGDGVAMEDTTEYLNNQPEYIFLRKGETDYLRLKEGQIIEVGHRSLLRMMEKSNWEK